MSTPILLLNAGSSSIKYQVIDADDEDVLASGIIQRIGDEAGTITERQEFEAPAQTEQTVTVTIPDGAPAEVLVTISVDNPMRPGQAGRGSKDPRTLGVAVREIALT